MMGMKKSIVEALQEDQWPYRGWLGVLCDRHKWIQTKFRRGTQPPIYVCKKCYLALFDTSYPPSPIPIQIPVSGM